MAARLAHVTSSSSHGNQWDALQGFKDALQEISRDWYDAISSHNSLMQEA
jgi:hypothetical protein